jgi:quinol monooxygenase YgiN
MRGSFYEDWRTSADLDAHMQAPYVQAFIKDAPALCQDVETCTYGA